MLEDLINGRLTVRCYSKSDFDTLDSIIRTYAGDQISVWKMYFKRGVMI